MGLADGEAWEKDPRCMAATPPEKNLGGRPPKPMTDFDPREHLAYTIEEAAAATGVCKASIWKKVKDGDVWTFKWCGRTLILASVLKDAVRRSAQACAPAGVEVEL